MCISRRKNMKSAQSGVEKPAIQPANPNDKMPDTTTPSATPAANVSAKAKPIEDPAKTAPPAPVASGPAPSVTAPPSTAPISALPQKALSPAISATQASAPRSLKVVKETAPPKSKEGKSDVDQKKSGEEKSREKVSELKKIAERATEAPRPPAIEPPRELKAKRVVEGLREAKDPAYATLDDEFPEFKKAVLRGSSKEPMREQRTQPQTWNEEKRKKESLERTPK